LACFLICSRFGAAARDLVMTTSFHKRLCVR
jgi:hypothetical protein